MIRVFHAPCALAVGISVFVGSGSLHAQTSFPAVVVSARTETPLVPNTAHATAMINRIAGGVEVVPDTTFKNGPAATLKDVLAWVPGVFTSEARYGDDVRVSIRGSGLSRPYGNRGINMYMDGIPINTSDGLVDLFEIDPSAYRYAEVFKGANGMRYGANSLGGAVNFVTPTGYDAPRFQARLDAGSFGRGRIQASGSTINGNMDGFMTGSVQREDGERDHIDGHQERISGNLGYRFSPDAETRLYVNANRIRDHMAGELDEATALSSPHTANGDFVWKDQQRNIDSYRIANKTTVRWGDTRLEFGLYHVHRHVDHPNWSYLDYSASDNGGFARVTDDREISGLRNTLAAGINVQDGTITSKSYWYANTYPYGSYPVDAIAGASPGAVKAALASSTVDRPRNASIYVDDSLFVRPDLTLNLGVGFQHAERPRDNRLNPAQSGKLTFNNATPKIGLLWDLTPSSQLFTNISRSAEAPTYDVNAVVTVNAPLKVQTATTYEVGTRGHLQDVHWDVSLYRARIHDELQCISTYPGSCTAINAAHTVHQGIEAGAGIAFLKSVFAGGDGLLLNASYVYNDFHFDNDPVYGNNRLAGVPTQLVRAELLYRHPGGFYAGPNVEWMPLSYFADNANTTKVGRYALLNFRLGIDKTGTGWSAYLEGRNLTGKRYVSAVDVAGLATAQSEIFYPGTGRSIHAGVDFSF